MRPPPSAMNFIDRRIFIYAPVRLTFTATSTAADQQIINSSQDAPRQYGMNASIDVANCTCNNYSFSNNIADYVHALTKYNIDDCLRGRLYSTTPTYADQSQLYSYLIGATNNPLGLYNDGNDSNNPPRGGFPNYRIVANPVSTDTGQVLVAMVDIAFFEPFFLLSPLYFGKDETHPFVHVNTMD